MTIETFKENGFTVKIGYDEDAYSPRSDGYNAANLVLWGRNYDFPNDAGIDLDAFSGWDEVAKELSENYDALVVSPVWVYEHSGIALKAGEARTYPFDDPWDSAQAGVAYVTRQTWSECQGTAWTGSDEDVATAHRLIQGDVETYSKYVNGEVYYYSIQDFDGEVVDACGGFYGYEDVESEAKGAANELEHQVKCNGTLNRTTGLVEHTETCALHGGDENQ